MKNFETLGIGKGFVKGLNELNIVTPTEIQKEVIPLLLSTKTDLVAQAQTGTGKTAAYGLPLLHIVEPTNKAIQGLILCPTRELGQQVAKQLFRFTKYTDKIFTEAVYGGAPMDRQISNLKRPTHLVVATPGRLIDLVARKALDLSQVKTVVLDEADEMLSMGFKKELDEILSFLPNVEQTWLFSATIPQGIKQIIQKHMAENAHNITVDSQQVVNENIEHHYLICKETEKFRELTQFLKVHKQQRGLVFCVTKAATQKLTDRLLAENMAVTTIHGDLQQRDRDKAMRAFKNESIPLLVATDIAARGIDVEGLSFVVHYQLPDKEEYYTHRSGRTARAGKKGISFSLVTPLEMELLRKLEKNLGISFLQMS